LDTRILTENNSNVFTPVRFLLWITVLTHTTQHVWGTEKDAKAFTSTVQFSLFRSRSKQLHIVFISAEENQHDKQKSQLVCNSLHLRQRFWPSRMTLFFKYINMVFWVI
jgi:hypothetical protein